MLPGPVFGRSAPATGVVTVATGGVLGAVVAVEDVTVTGFDVAVFDGVELDGAGGATETVAGALEPESESVNLPYAQRVPINTPKSIPPTIRIPKSVNNSAVGRLTESVALI